VKTAPPSGAAARPHGPAFAHRAEARSWLLGAELPVHDARSRTVPARAADSAAVVAAVRRLSFMTILVAMSRGWGGVHHVLQAVRSLDAAGCRHVARAGDMAALARYCVDTDAGIISVRASVVELARGPLVTGPPKSAAGKRDVTIPALLLPDVTAHLEDFTAADPRALVLTGPKGAQLRRSNFTWAWSRATAAGLPGFHFHDLRHTGNALAGEEGASLRELMERMGHSSSRAALIYQHRTMHRDRMIADAMGKRAEAELKRSGTQRARGKDNRS
jgi:integrase